MIVTAISSFAARLFDGRAMNKVSPWIPLAAEHLIDNTSLYKYNLWPAAFQVCIDRNNAAILLYAPEIDETGWR